MRRLLATIFLLWALLHAPIGSQGAESPSLSYPATRRDTVVDDFFGTRVADPYRWLEQLDSAETSDWVKAQMRLSTGYFASLPGRDSIRRRLMELSEYGQTAVPWREAGKLFYAEAGGRQQPALYVVSAPDDAPRVVLEPREISPDGSVAVGDYAVSPDGRWVAYSMSAGGADAGETRVRALDTGRPLDDVVRGTRGTACFTFDGGGFFYVRSPAAEPGAARLEKQLYYHVLGRPTAEDRFLHEWKDAQWLYCMMSDDGRRAIVVAERGSNASLYTLDLRDPKAPDLTAALVPLLADRESGNTPLGTVGDTLFVASRHDAPRGRIIALDLNQGAAARPRTVIAESADVIRFATVAGDRLAVHYLVDVRSELRLFHLDGRPAGAVALPGIGALGWLLCGRASAPELLYSFSSFLAPSTVYRYDLASGRSVAFRPPRLPFDAGAYETRQVFYTSKDGTRVPMFITARKKLRRDGANPTLLTGYGGYGAIVGPSFEPERAMWLAMGGIYAVANLRGGGEYGEAWHQAGSLERKQNSFDDFIAAAQYLVAERYTSPGRLAIYGHSNGGLLMGAVMTQRPDLFAAVVANAGHYDMLRYHKFTVGAGWIPEYGSPERPDDFRVLRAYSPLHNVRDKTCYPATLLLAADHDDRVVPSHAYKFAATLQAAQGCDRPILLRVASDASHSYASESAAIAEQTDMWSFVAARLGVAFPK